VLHELLAGPVATLFDPFQDIKTLTFLEPTLEKVCKRINIVCGEGGRLLKDAVIPVRKQSISLFRSAVVKVRARAELDRIFTLVEGGVGVLKILLVLSDLR